jgi:hypothetical protein
MKTCGCGSNDCKALFTSALNATSRAGRLTPVDKTHDTRSLAGEWVPQSVRMLWGTENLKFWQELNSHYSASQAVALLAEPSLLP